MGLAKIWVGNGACVDSGVRSAAMVTPLDRVTEGEGVAVRWIGGFEQRMRVRWLVTGSEEGRQKREGKNTEQGSFISSSSSLLLILVHRSPHSNVTNPTIIQRTEGNP